MKIKDLIKKLREFDQELPVVISGYEGGVNDVSIIKETKIDLNVNSQWYYGDHEQNSDGKVKAVILHDSEGRGRT